MARRNMSEHLIPKEDIWEEMKLIEESNTDYVTPSGNIYKDYGNNMFFHKKTHENKNNHYIYCGITCTDGINRQRRVHVLVARAFLPNPNNLPIVGHKNNDKTNPSVSNLYWTTTSENTKKAFDDGLAKNDKSWDDSQSIPVCAFDMNFNLIGTYGSVGECYRALGKTKTAILNQCNHNLTTKPRGGYYFRYLSEYQEKGFVL